MTDSIDIFLNDVKAATKSVSDSQMASRFGVTRQTISCYRTGRAFPSDETIIEMAKRSGIDPDEALLLLNVWRSQGETKKRYQGLLYALKKSAAAVLFSCSILGHYNFSEAKELELNNKNNDLQTFDQDKLSTATVNTVYYEKYIFILYKLGKLFACFNSIKKLGKRLCKRNYIKNCVHPTVVRA